MINLIDEPELRVIELSLPQAMDNLELDQLNEALLNAVKQSAARKWVLDLSRVEYMGSAMLGVLVNLRQRVNESHGRLVLCGMSAELTEIFRTCCLDRLFTVARHLDQARLQLKKM